MWCVKIQKKVFCSLSVNFSHGRPFHYAIQGKFLLLTEFLHSWLSYNDSRLNFWIKDKVSVGDNKIYTDSNSALREIQETKNLQLFWVNILQSFPQVVNCQILELFFLECLSELIFYKLSGLLWWSFVITSILSSYSSNMCKLDL